MSKCRKCHLRETKFAKFPGGACPQTPLEAHAVGANRASLFLLKRGWNVCNYIYPFPCHMEIYRGTRVTWPDLLHNTLCLYPRLKANLRDQKYSFISLTSEKTDILPEQELVVKKFSWAFMYCTKSIIWSSMLPFLLRSTWERQDSFCLLKAAILLTKTIHEVWNEVINRAAGVLYGGLIFSDCRHPHAIRLPPSRLLAVEISCKHRFKLIHYQRRKVFEHHASKKGH